MTTQHGRIRGPFQYDSDEPPERQVKGPEPDRDRMAGGIQIPPADSSLWQSCPDSRGHWKERAEKAEADVERLRSRLDVTSEEFGCVPVSFASLCDSIDSRHLQEQVENLVTWHIRRADRAEAQLKASPPAPSGWQQQLKAAFETGMKWSMPWSEKFEQESADRGFERFMLSSAPLPHAPGKAGD